MIVQALHINECGCPYRLLLWPRWLEGPRQQLLRKQPRLTFSMLPPLKQLVLLLAGGSLVGAEFTAKEAAVAVSELQQW